LLDNFGINGPITGTDDLSEAVRSGVTYFALGARLAPPSSQETLKLVQLMQRRHKGDFLAGFCDGHIEKCSISQLFNVSHEDVAKRWNNDNLPHHEVLSNIW
jgi:hypothetical protein